MQGTERHIINKLFLEVNTQSKKNAYYLKDHIDAFLKDELFPLLETYFDTLDKKMPQHSLQIEKLNMDFSIAPDLDFESIKLEIISQFQKQIENQIDKGFPDSGQYTLIHNKEKSTNEFFSFLETGMTPWWSVSKDILYTGEEHSFDELISEKSFEAKITVAIQDRQTRTRFIKQLSDEQIYDILKKTFLSGPASEETVSRNIRSIRDNMPVLAGPSKLGLQQRNLIWDIVLSKLLKHSESTLTPKTTDLILSFDLVRKYNPQFISENIEIITQHIKKKSVLEVLSNLENEVLLTAAILKEKALEAARKNSKEPFSKSDTQETDTPESVPSVPETTKEADVSFDSEKEKTTEERKEYKKEYKKEDKKEERNETVQEEEILPAALLLNEEIIQDEPSNYYVNNVGLILIHPFLKHLFENCGLLNKDNSINNTEVAAHLLHYIATEKEQDYENEMSFEKLLCNIPVKQTINRNIILSEELKNHANEMLRAVLDNWPVMKNASFALFRNEYLQRPGKIILTEDNPKILVERRTQDILLDKIGWNLGVVKLAWKKKIIFVDW